MTSMYTIGQILDKTNATDENLDIDFIIELLKVYSVAVSQILTPPSM